MKRVLVLCIGIRGFGIGPALPFIPSGAQILEIPTITEHAASFAVKTTSAVAKDPLVARIIQKGRTGRQIEADCPSSDCVPRSTRDVELIELDPQIGNDVIEDIFSIADDFAVLDELEWRKRGFGADGYLSRLSNLGKRLARLRRTAINERNDHAEDNQQPGKHRPFERWISNSHDHLSH